MQDMNVYWSEAEMDRVGATPSILAIGDSWFWYPFPGGSLISLLGPVVAPKSHVILVKGMNGAEVFDYVEGKYRRTVDQALRLYGDSLSAVFISGGGNDFAGFNDMRPLLNLDCANAHSAEECFNAGGSGLPDFLDRMDRHYRTLIGRVYTRTSLDCRIVMHAYDYAIPDGRGALGHPAWLQPALSDANVPPALQQACVKYLIDAFFDMLSEITKGDPAHLLLVDSRGTLAAGDWANELHPKPGGFKKIVKYRWQPLLEQAGLA
jgi:hypothetical protein